MNEAAASYHGRRACNRNGHSDLRSPPRHSLDAGDELSGMGRSAETNLS
jgi:hypothetical protein